MDNVKIILNNSRSVERVNKDSFVKISLDNTSRLLPVGDINEIINVGEVFNKERQNSKIYRFNFTINLTKYNLSLCGSFYPARYERKIKIIKFLNQTKE
mgnify:CR=1 FL=1